MNANFPNIDCRSLHAFCEVALLSSFSLAAERMGVSQAAVSKIIRRLETELRVALFARTTRHIQLTAQGRAFLPAAKRALEELTASAALLSDTDTPAGLLRVTVIASFARLHLINPIAEFLRAFPRVQLAVNFCSGQQDLLDEGYDLSIGHPGAARPSHIARLLCTWQYVLVASPGYLATHAAPLHPSELVKHDCICPSNGFGPVEPWEFVKMKNLSRRANYARARAEYIHMPKGPLVAMGQLEAVAEAAIAGLGITVAASSLVRDSLVNGHLKVLLPEWRMRAGSDILMLYRRQEFLPARLRLLIDHLADRVKRDPMLMLNAVDLKRFAA